jgi:Spy/CpxP family protein refolding chaperone
MNKRNNSGRGADKMDRNSKQSNKNLFLILVLSVILLFPAVESFAMKADEGEGPGFKRGYFKEKYGRENMRGKETPDLLETFRLVRMVQLLELDQEQAAQMGVIFKERTETHHDLMRAKREMGQELRRLLKDEEIKEADLNKIIDRSNDLRREFFDKEEAFEVRIQALMDTEQKAKYLLFNESFHRDILKNLRQVREGFGEMRGMNPPDSSEQGTTEQDRPHDPPPPGPMGPPE